MDTACPQLASDLLVSNQISFPGNSSEVAGQQSINCCEIQAKCPACPGKKKTKKNNERLSGQDPTDLMLLKSYR